MACRKDIPALKGLLAFEAAVRLGSMTSAAKELGTTQPAVSQQIRALEELVGGSLLDRSGSKLGTTEAGAHFHEDIVGALSDLHSAVQRAQAKFAQHVPTVSIAANFGFAHLWLLPRLPALQERFPHLRFEVFADDHQETWSLQDVDIAISFDRLGEPHQTEVLLAAETVFPVCSPQFAREHGLQGELSWSDLEALPLLHMDQSNPRWLDWERWSARAGIGAWRGGGRFSFNNYPLLLNATIQGQGLALAWHELVSQPLKVGALVALGPTVVREDHGYLLKSRHLQNALISPVVRWLQEQMS
ncbi:LysR substrate-binding domain-containing protein [Pseudomonas putida]|uniref:LysR substrate-binding domain-containing protein n=1 Tax=Pseudomonas putida TaxID=303 RepID=UPI0027712826|nr:LysR substrate-binding domain-containing protein [Pseudomonas putida]MDP9524328.1 LysR substrate-binding domain-containing protein [Pseudomonas putida]